MNAGAWVARRRRAPFEPVGERKDSAPRFTRFAAAMEAAPPPVAQVLTGDQVSPGNEAVPAGAQPLAKSKPIVVKAPPAAPTLPRVAPTPPAAASTPPRAAPTPPAASAAAQERKVAPKWAPKAAPEGRKPEIGGTVHPTADARVIAQPVIPRRPAVDDGNGSRIPWLGLASWLLLCGALFASLIGWPSEASLDRMSRLASFDRVSELWSRGWASLDSTIRPQPEDPTPVQSAALPQSEPAWSTLPATESGPTALPPTELAPPIGSADERTIKQVRGGPPVPAFKPIVDGVAAKFSNAFFEIGERLQKEGHADAASHMRRQGSNLDPWRPTTGSEL